MPTTAVFDASALIRAFVEPQAAARAWMEALDAGSVNALAPGVVFAEVANALALYVRTDRLDHDDVGAALATVVSLPLNVVPTRVLARQALALAVLRGISAYGACYLALALGHDAVLVTADRRLAEAADRTALLPHDLPPA